MTPVYWHKLLGRILKLNFDGLYELHSTNGGTGGVIRATGLWVFHAKSILLQLKGSAMKHTPREANKVANLLEVYQKKTKDPHMICNQPYVFDASLSLVKYALERDSMGTSFRSVPSFYG
ncbi:hypothetical protein H5410_050347 [Solanum commersonii]|uniref:RNase H type-1 domain-containing protein n=1 Tax=Solanum commersonii TaxID=4109 RepID=A0A9J5WXL2_SOLCO|nr:hypothetical protein H5410_050347 [Solanum commersonii]